MGKGFVSVAVPLPFQAPFTYRLPNDVPLPEPGCRVMVPFGGRRVIGVAIGGFVADRIRRHDRVLVICFAISALSIGVVASGFAPLWAIAGAIGIAGFMRGLVSPSRDLLARNAAPAGMLGTVMAVLTVGFTTGGSIIPVICGWLVDIGSGGAVFWLSVVMMGCAIASVFVARERSL